MPVPFREQLLASLERLAEGQLWQEIDVRLATLTAFTQPETLVLGVILKRAALAIRRGLAPSGLIT